MKETSDRLGEDCAMAKATETLCDAYDRVRDLFRRKGAYGRFKDVLATKGLLEVWHTFEDEREKAALSLWCDEKGLKLVDEATDALPRVGQNAGGTNSIT